MEETLICSVIVVIFWNRHAFVEENPVTNDCWYFRTWKKSLNPQ